MSISSQIKDFSALDVPDSDKTTKYIEIFKSIPNDQDYEASVTEFIKAVIAVPFGTSVARDILGQVIKALEEQKLDSSIETNILVSLIEGVAPQVMSYEDPDVNARLRLATIYEETENNMKASIILEQGLNRRCLSDDQRFEWYIRIIRNRLEIEDSTSAESFLKRAALIRHKAKNISPASLIHFQFSQARVLDSNRSFIEAARKYYDVSVASDVDSAEQEACLTMALTCVVLAPAGPQRSQILKLIYNDDRTKTVPNYDILEKLYTNRLLGWEELETFEKVLSPHQKVKLPDGRTVLERSVIDHNLLAVSRIYSNISVEQLAKLLGLEKAKVEDYASKMILQGRLAASIDQVDEVVEFVSRNDKNNMLQWENNVHALCSDLDGLVTEIGLIHEKELFSNA